MFKWKKRALKAEAACKDLQSVLDENKELKLQLTAVFEKELVELPPQLLDKVVRRSAAENAHHMLRCLISYHERSNMTAIYGPDCYLGALRYSLSLVEKELEKEKN